VAWAGKWSAADYPLRVHIFQFNAHSHYYNRVLDAVDGEGRANLYENGQPNDFSYQCGARLMVSPGFETYLARWKKPGRELNPPPYAGRQAGRDERMRSGGDAKRRYGLLQAQWPDGRGTYRQVQGLDGQASVRS
jgi:hypothetical protein